jgi:hypothetical protein
MALLCITTSTSCSRPTTTANVKEGRRGFICYVMKSLYKKIVTYKLESMLKT